LFCKATGTKRTIGILVLAEFKLLEDDEFIKAACSHAKRPSVIEVKFTKPHPRSAPLSPIESLPFNSATYTGLSPRKPRVRLYGLSPSVVKDFLLSDLEFPVGVAGFVLIVNLHGAALARLHWPETLTRFRKDISFEEAVRKGKIRWIREHQLPFVVATTDPAPPAISLDELRDLFDLEP